MTLKTGCPYRMPWNLTPGVAISQGSFSGLRLTGKLEHTVLTRSIPLPTGRS